jgi:hypothetical protein
LNSFCLKLTVQGDKIGHVDGKTNVVGLCSDQTKADHKSACVAKNLNFVDFAGRIENKKIREQLAGKEPNISPSNVKTFLRRF